MNNSISIKNISKCYKIYNTRNERLKEWMIPFSKKRHKEKWVLKDINLEIKKGEAVGIIGMNGAGKSTLLKIITGTTMPTTGKVTFNGTVAALLELGIGFHPDFTGRQNVYMSGQLLGYTNSEIDAGMEDVEKFAEIGEAIDAPVRTYSSGMQVRLAFSVATMKRPDILIVDEALSVGDDYFQHKSFARIQEFRKQGTTLLLVSHDKAAIQAVCDRAILLDHGQILKIGNPEEIMDYYNALISEKDDIIIEQKKLSDGRIQTISGTNEVKSTDVYMLNSKGLKAKVFSVGEKVKLIIKADILKDIDLLNCGFMIKDVLGQTHFGTNIGMHNKMIYNLKKETKLEISFEFILNIGEGNYSISTAFIGDGTHIEKNYEWLELATVFQVLNTKKYPFIGYTYLKDKVEIKYIK